MGGSNSAEAPKEDEDPPVNVDTGDSVKVKQTLDEAVVKAVLDHGYEEHHTLDNAKLLLMLVACSFAMVAQFWPIPFPASRPLLGVCCSMYFVLSGILQLVVWFVERDARAVGAVDDEEERVGPGEVVAPERPDLVLAADVPDRQVEVLVLEVLDVEADRRDRLHALVQLELVQHGRLARGVEAEHEQAPLLRA